MEVFLPSRGNKGLPSLGKTSSKPAIKVIEEKNTQHIDK